MVPAQKSWSPEFSAAAKLRKEVLFWGGSVRGRFLICIYWEYVRPQKESPQVHRNFGEKTVLDLGYVPETGLEYVEGWNADYTGLINLF